MDIKPPLNSAPAPEPLSADQPAVSLSPSNMPLSGPPPSPPPVRLNSAPRPHYLGFILTAASAVVVLGILGWLVWTGLHRAVQSTAANYAPVHVPLSSLANINGLTDSASSLKINGRLQVSDTLVLAPTSRPSTGVAGQLYYDRDANQLAYYNGQGFVGLASGTATTNTTNNNTTNITNVLSGAGSGVQLQSTTPGVPQTGHLDITGTATVGTLSTTVIDSAGSTLYINPKGATQQQSVAAGTPSSIGLTNGTQTTGPGWNNDASATKITMGNVGGTATSISVFFSGGTAGKHYQVAIYDDNGDVPSQPSTLLSTSAVTNLVPNSLNTVTIPSINLLASGTYWLALNTDDNTVARTYNGGNKSSCFVSRTFGSMADPFTPFSCFFDDNQYSIALNYLAGAGVSGSLSQAAMVVGPTGQILLQNSEDSNTALRVQNAAGTSTIFNIDTINGRVGVGKANPTFKLDVAAGDINLSNAHSLRFGGLQVVSVNSSGSTVSVTNFVPSGAISVQADNVYIQNANGTHHNLAITSNGSATFSNLTDSTTGFQIQNSAGSPLLVADTAGMALYVGDPAGSATPVILYLASKTTAGDPATGAEGGTYYNSTLQSFRCYHTGFWHNCADLEPQHSFSVYDEFMGGGTSFTGPIGSLNWTAAAIGANGTLVRNPASPAPDADRPGILQIQTPAVNGQGTTLLLGDSAGAGLLLGKDNDLKTAVAVGAASGNVLRIGLHNQTTSTGQPVSGVWWEANPGASANWRYCYGDGATATCADSSVAITAATWATLEIRITATGNAASAATFVINNIPQNVTGVTIDTAGRVSPALSCYATTAATQACSWDYFQLTGTTSSRR